MQLKKGFSLAKEDICKVAEFFGVLEAPMGYLDTAPREDLEPLICNPSEIDGKKFCFRSIPVGPIA